MSGRSHRFLGFNQYSRELMRFASRAEHGTVFVILIVFENELCFRLRLVIACLYISTFKGIPPVRVTGKGNTSHNTYEILKLFIGNCIHVYT